MVEQHRQLAARVRRRRNGEAARQIDGRRMPTSAVPYIPVDGLGPATAVLLTGRDADPLSDRLVAQVAEVARAFESGVGRLVGPASW